MRDRRKFTMRVFCTVIMLTGTSFAQFTFNPTDIRPAKGPTVPIESRSPIKISVVSFSAAQQVFQEMKSRRDLGLSPARLTCFATAHKIAWLLERKGVHAGKIYLTNRTSDDSESANDRRMFGDDDVGPSEFRIPVNDRGKQVYVQWLDHWAVVLAVGDPEDYSLYVVDPILLGRVVRVGEWLAHIRNHSNKVVGSYRLVSRFSYNSFNLDSPLPTWENLKKAEEKLRMNENEKIRIDFWNDQSR